MQIGKINSFSYYKPYYCPALKNSVPNFKAGYRDIANEWDKIIFDRTLEMQESMYKKSQGLKEKTVYLNGDVLTLTPYRNGFYILKSQDGDIKATMKTEEQDCKTENCQNDFYSKNNGAVKIALLFAKGNGAGSYMIKEAVKRSMKKGYRGRVILEATNVFDSTGSPIPFYYKAGFKAFDAKSQEYIERTMEEYERTGFYEQDGTIDMYLDPDRIEDYLD